jgi:protease IV
MADKRSPIITVLIILAVVLSLLGGTTALITHMAGGPDGAVAFSRKIGVIPIEGPIHDSRELLSQIIAFRRDDTIRAIVLRIDSPGGGVAPAQELYQEIRRTTGTKSVIASAGGVAASGGYYIASAADRIVANPGTIMGSIGVIMEFLQVQELLRKVGVGLEVLKSGEFKDTGSPHREMTPDERELMMEVIQDVQDQFVDAVATGRGLPLEEVRRIADGRIFSGARGKELGLVDLLGNFQDAVELAGELAGIRGEATLVYPKGPAPKLLDFLMESAARGVVNAARDLAHSRPAYLWKDHLMN